MSVTEPRPQPREPNRFINIPIWCGIVVLGLMFAGLTVYRILARDAGEVDTAEIKALEVARTALPVPTGAEWPQWRGPNRDGVSTEKGLLDRWPDTGPKVLWNRPLVGDKAQKDTGYSSVVVARGLVFTMVQDGEDEAVVCWEAATGKERWRFKYAAHFRQPYGDGPRSTPAIAGEHIYSVGGSGIVHCLKAFTSNPAGESVWRKDLLRDLGGKSLEWGISFSPLVENGLVHVMPGGPGGKSLAALDADTGSVVWQVFNDEPSYSSPVAADLAGRRQVVWLTGERVVGLAPDTGKLLWDYPWPAGPAHTPSCIATPLVMHVDVADYVFISAGYGKGCALLKIEIKGEAFNARQVYKNLNMQNVFSTSIRQGDYLYGFDDVNLKCLEWRTGKVRWKEHGFGKGSVTAADGHLIVLSDNGTLVLAAADPAGFREESRFEHADQPSSWTVPVVVGGKLFVRDKKRLVCYEVKKSR